MFQGNIWNLRHISISIHIQYIIRSKWLYCFLQCFFFFSVARVPILIAFWRHHFYTDRNFVHGLKAGISMSAQHCWTNNKDTACIVRSTLWNLQILLYHCNEILDFLMSKRYKKIPHFKLIFNEIKYVPWWKVSVQV